MPLLINGVPIEDAPRDLRAFFHQFPHFKESSAALCSMKPQVVGPLGLLYIFAREFAVTHPHDGKVSILGTDDVTTAHILVLRHTGESSERLCSPSFIIRRLTKINLARVIDDEGIIAFVFLHASSSLTFASPAGNEGKKGRNT